MINIDSISPTEGDNATGFEWIWNIAKIGVTPRVWVNVPDMKDLNPTAPPKTADDTTYANKGSDSVSKTGETWSAQVSVKGVRDLTGEFQPELLTLIEAADAIGKENVIAYQYYHATSSVLAYEGTCGVEWSRASTGASDVEFFNFTLSGKGDRVKIANPGITPPTP